MRALCAKTYHIYLIASLSDNNIMKTQKIHSSKTIEKNRKKIISLSDLEKNSCTYIFTKGVFDIIHAGHLSLFSYIESIKKSHKVVIGIASDRVTKEKKGDDRPINNEEIRLDQIAALSTVDYVFLHDDPNYINVISKLKPTIYIKGMDTAIEEGASIDFSKNNPELCQLPNSSLFIIYCDDGTLSTTQLIENIHSRK